MKKITDHFSYELFDSSADLPEEDKKLLALAVEAADTAYAPYSEFHVGAAVLMENGEIVIGSNQENAAYPSGLCAERVAVFAAASQYPDVKIKTIAITAKFNNGTDLLSVSPCGDCRQVMAEYEHRFDANIRLILTGSNNQVLVIPGIKTLLPLMFNAENLKR